jgi:hypothetical protein
LPPVLFRFSGPALCLISVLASASQAQAQSSGKYDISIAGLQVGQAAMEAKFERSTYEVGASVRLSGVAKLVTTGKGSATASGRLGSTLPQGDDYELQLTTGAKSEAVSIGMTGGNVTQLSVSPEHPIQPDTVPLLSQHRANILDPLSAGIFVSAKPSSALSADACGKTYPVFDGRQRYDLTFRFDRKASFQTEGFNGEVLVCKAQYKPIAGHQSERSDVKFLASSRDMEVWLAPVKGTRVFVPAKIMIRLPMGLARIEATKLDLGADPEVTGSISQ